MHKKIRLNGRNEKKKKKKKRSLKCDHCFLLENKNNKIPLKPPKTVEKPLSPPACMGQSGAGCHSSPSEQRGLGPGGLSRSQGRNPRNVSFKINILRKGGKKGPARHRGTRYAGTAGRCGYERCVATPAVLKINLAFKNTKSA